MSYVLVWEGNCSPPTNTETIAVPSGKVVYITRSPSVNDASITVSNCTQGVNYTMPAGGEGNSMQIDVADNDVLCLTGRSRPTVNSVMIDVINPR